MCLRIFSICFIKFCTSVPRYRLINYLRIFSKWTHRFVKIFGLSCEFTNLYGGQAGLIICGHLVNGLKHLREGAKFPVIVTNHEHYCRSSFKSELFNWFTKSWSVLRSFRLLLQILSATGNPGLSWNCSINLRNLGTTLRPQCKISTF